jgi:uncharacterized protein (DUF2147 family)
MGVLVQSSGNFQKMVGLYENPLLEYWVDKYADSIKDSMIPLLFSKEQSDNPTEAISEMVGAIDFTQWNGEFTYADAKEGNSKVWTPLVWQSGKAYDRFLLSNAKLMNMKDDFSKFAIGAARTREAVAAGIFSNADQTSFSVNGVSLAYTLTANSVALASNSQTSANYSTSQDNLEVLELNETNLETVCQKMFDAKDEDGKDANLQPDTLIVPTALRKTALELIGGEGKVDTADNNPNIYYGSMKVIVWKQFRKQTGKTGNPWVVVDSQMAKDSMKWINRLESGDDYEIISWKNEETQTWKVGAIMWFSAGAYDWRPFQFSIPA